MFSLASQKTFVKLSFFLSRLSMASRYHEAHLLRTSMVALVYCGKTSEQQLFREKAIIPNISSWWEFQSHYFMHPSYVVWRSKFRCGEMLKATEYELDLAWRKSNASKTQTCELRALICIEGLAKWEIYDGEKCGVLCSSWESYPNASTNVQKSHGTCLVRVWS